MVFSHLTLFYSVLMFLIFLSDQNDCLLIRKVFAHFFIYFLDIFSCFFLFLNLVPLPLGTMYLKVFYFMGYFLAIFFRVYKIFIMLFSVGLICAKTIFAKNINFGNRRELCSFQCVAYAFYLSDAILFYFTFFIFPSDWKDCWLICKVFIHFSFFLWTFLCRLCESLYRFHTYVTTPITTSFPLVPTSTK